MFLTLEIVPVQNYVEKCMMHTCLNDLGIAPFPTRDSAQKGGFVPIKAVRRRPAAVGSFTCDATVDIEEANSAMKSKSLYWCFRSFARITALLKCAFCQLCRHPEASYPRRVSFVGMSVFLTFQHDTRVRAFHC